MPIERFIACPISIVSSVPDAPTSAPLTISTLEPSSKPVAAAARPVKAFSSEITTGMSAPPIGSTNSTPKSSDPMSTRQEPLLLRARHDRDAARDDRGEQREVHELLARIRDRPTADQLLQLRERDHRARERDAPISADATIAAETSPCSRPGSGARLWNSASATSAAAPPPTPLNSATICGIAVIFTRRAATAPNVPPIAEPTTIRQYESTCSFASVTTIAIAMPTAPIQFPRRASSATRGTAARG